MSSHSGTELPHKCQHCQRILLDKPIEKVQYAQYEVTLPHSQYEVFQAVQDGCPFFALFPKLPFYNLTLSESLNPVHWQPYEVSYNTEGDFDLRCMNWLSEPDTMRVVASSEDPAAHDIDLRPINLQADSERVFDFLRVQMQECTVNHTQTCPATAQDFIPTRVIRIDEIDRTLSIRLYMPEKEEKIRWCALSYCWGEQIHAIKTTLETVEERYSGIDLETLPKTLRDGVMAAFRLGLNFIWIDSICIVQDDPDEMTREISRMAEIYSKAYITLSASRASNASEGFLHDLSVPKSMTPISLRYVCGSGSEGSLVLTNESTPNDLPDPINSRAWTFQERVLSPRLVEFSSTQVRWRCNSSVKCESGCPPRTAWKTYFEAPSIISKQSMDTLETSDQTREWNSLVTAYTKRDLSFSTDKLIAFSAIAKTIGRPSRYLAGLWESELPCNLLWKVYHVWFPIAGNIDKRRPRPPAYRAPSWSWASVDGEVRCDTTALDSSGPEPACEVLDCQVTLLDPNSEFGAVSNGHITIRGRIRPAVFVASTGDLYFQIPGTPQPSQAVPTSGYKGFSDAINDGQDEGAILVWCFHIRNFSGRGEGLLLVEQAGDEAFRRIGHFYWSVSEVGAEFQHSKVRDVKII